MKPIDYKTKYIKLKEYIEKKQEEGAHEYDFNTLYQPKSPYDQGYYLGRIEAIENIMCFIEDVLKDDLKWEDTWNR